MLLGGSGSRFGANIPKQFLNLGDHKLFAKTSRNLLQALKCDEIVFVVHPQYRNENLFLQELENLQKEFPSTRQWIALGKENRHQSFRSGWLTWLAHSTLDVQKVRLLVHDANRPHLNKEFLQRIEKNLDNLSEKDPCFVPVISATDSMLQVDTGGRASEYLPRDLLKRVQTPQLIWAPALHEKIHLAKKKDTCATLGT